ncbi:S-layer homology domain-containing protein [Paraliobacillus salinarum]|uniref:S-layer homology domain-containing protein n=1 Tax=Paraliobacillus salinarum TaxID=1158996 RepID=UPI0015F440EC|nr:S-layer homology domain-containing protein [Paraliobacillus salinarum]
MKRKIAVVFLGVIMISNLILPTITFAKDDITGHQFEYDLRIMIEEGIMGGYPDGLFKPDNSVTRAEFTKLLVESLQLTGESTSHSFTDVKDSVWYTKPIAIAINHNLISGYPDGTFKPNNKISREQMTGIIQRALHQQGVTSKEKELTFSDTSKIHKDFRSSVAKLYYHGIMNGKGNNLFAPKDYTTRGETAAVLNRMLKTINNPKTVITNTHYDRDFNKMIDIQMTKTPKVDGAGQYIASREMVSYYANPKNFSSNSSDFLQFLDLAENTGLNTSEVNNKILTNKYKLSGQAKAFVEAGKVHNVNEVYLIAHTLHETGNGKSTLAQGVPVDGNGKVVSANNAKHTVYNFYGYGAVDSNPLNGGAKYAFDNKWFTPEAAIIGGAADIADNYINDGQNTLYKMRWNPDSPGYPQYATHVMWAVLQTKNMSKIYNLLDSYVQKFDVPTFNNQPKATAKPTGVAQYHVDTTLAGRNGTTNATSLNFRTGPTTGFDAISAIPHGSQVTLIGENGGWYKIKYNGSIGWVAGQYVDLETKAKTFSISGFTKENDNQAEEIKDITDNIFGETNVETIPLLSSPSTNDDSTFVRDLELSTTVKILDQNKDWYKVILDQEEGWVQKEFITIK